MNESYQLFHSESCGFCHRVRRYLGQAGWEIPLRDIWGEPDARRELVAGGGRATVPCLRIERPRHNQPDRGEAADVVWLYESLDIIDYLQARRLDDGS